MFALDPVNVFWVFNRKNIQSSNSATFAGRFLLLKTGLYFTRIFFRLPSGKPPLIHLVNSRPSFLDTVNFVVDLLDESPELEEFDEELEELDEVDEELDDELSLAEPPSSAMTVLSKN